MQSWFKLDNAAKIFPPTQTKEYSSMFRLSVTLTEPVDKEILLKAQENILCRFPNFACRLKKGFFWYYFEHIKGSPPIYKDIYNPMQKINLLANRFFLYRILYLNNRIALEFFHVLTDGTGGLTFLLSLTAEYLHLKYGIHVNSAKYVLSCRETPSAEEYEDSYLRYAKQNCLSKFEKVSYHPSGTEVPLNKLLIISGKVPTEILKERAKDFNVSIGVFLTAVLIDAVHKQQVAERCRKKRGLDLKIIVPVNLRRFFPSRTTRNFFTYISPGINGQLGEFSFEEILEQVKHFMGMHTTRKELNARFSSNVAAERNILVRLVPLFIKIPALKLGFHILGDRYAATTLTNLGNVTVPASLESYIKRFDFIFGRSSDKRTNCACISYGNQTIINFSRTMIESDTEKYFFSALVEMGVPVSVQSNGSE